MKIGLIIYGDLSTLSGGYLYDRRLVQILQAQGCEVEVLSLPWRNYAAHLLDNADTVLLERLVKADFDILLQDELNHPSLFLLNRRLRARINTPVVSIVHHLRSHETHPAVLLPLYRAVESRYLRTVDAFLVNSWTTRRAVEAHIPQPRPIHVAYPAGDHLAAPSPNLVRAGIEQHASSITMDVAFVGNVIPRKALHTVVESLALLRRNHPEKRVTLHVIGDLDHAPDYVAGVRRFISENRLTDWVEFYGRVGDSELGATLRQCQVMAVPSFEGFGIVYLEAMGHGLCPIAATGGAAQEIVHHGVNGLLVPPNSPLSLYRALLYLLEHPQTRNQLRYAALKAYASHLSWEESMVAAYQWLCEITH